MRTRYPKMHLDTPSSYQIKLLGRLGLEWSSSFDNLQLKVEKNENGQSITIISGAITDQAALHGLLNQIRDLGMDLLLVEWLKH